MTLEMVRALIATALGVSGLVALFFICQEAVCALRERGHDRQLWRAFTVGYRKGFEEYRSGGAMASPAERLVVFHPLGRRRDRDYATGANTITATRMGRIEGWRTALSKGVAPEPGEGLDRQISVAVEEMQVWSYDEYRKGEAA